jgi:hypothetical protein
LCTLNLLINPFDIIKNLNPALSIFGTGTDVYNLPVVFSFGIYTTDSPFSKIKSVMVLRLLTEKYTIIYPSPIKGYFSEVLW